MSLCFYSFKLWLLSLLFLRQQGSLSSFLPDLVSSFTLKSYSSLMSLHRKQKKRRKERNKIIFTNETIVIDKSNHLCADDEEIYIHGKLMDEAISEATKAGEVGEVPIGAIVVKEEVTNHMNSNERRFTILSRGQNQIETIHDASAHAELQALRKASQNIQNWRLINTTLYTTLEPCPMCLSAAQAFRVSKIVYGAPDLRLGAVETHIQLLDIVKHPFHDTMEVVGGIQKDECGKLLVNFFRARRKQSKTKKPEDMNLHIHTQTVTRLSSILNFFRRNKSKKVN